MVRNIIEINEDKCVGCGLCINACAEGALQLVDGKAKLITDAYCDGLGACLPKCPTGAMSIIQREADEFNEELVSKKNEELNKKEENLACGCPGTLAKTIERRPQQNIVPQKSVNMESQLRQWPCQIKLVSPNAPYFKNADLLVAADCTAFAYANIHSDYMRNKVTIIGCPKLDEVNYADKLTDIIKRNDIQSVTVLRMEVPCCGGIENAVKNALIQSGKMIPWRIVVIGTDGSIIRD